MVAAAGVSGGGSSVAYGSVHFYNGVSGTHRWLMLPPDTQAGASLVDNQRMEGTKVKGAVPSPGHRLLTPTDTGNTLFQWPRLVF